MTYVSFRDFPKASDRQIENSLLNPRMSDDRCHFEFKPLEIEVENNSRESFSKRSFSTSFNFSSSKITKFFCELFSSCYQGINKIIR